MGSITDDASLPTLPQHIDTIQQVRTGAIKPAFGEHSGIFKTPQSSRVKVSFARCGSDERAWEGHAGPDNALHHYDARHYAVWRRELPECAHLFEPGAFGENIVSVGMSEQSVCIGDIWRFGEEVVVQVSKPRAPCYKLNHRFGVRDMSLRSQNARRTGWYYRVLKEGWIGAGDEIVLLERSIRGGLLRGDIKDEVAMKELAYLPELGEEIRNMFLNRLTKKIFIDDSLRLEGGEANVLKWTRYRLVSKTKETPRIYSFIFEAVTASKEAAKVEPGSHIRVKLGKEGKLVRAYSVVGGDANRFELGVALDKAESRGGSEYLHEAVKPGDILSFSEMESDFPVQENAECHVLIAGGIGITAFIASARHLQEQGSAFHLYYAVRSAGDVAFGRFIQTFGASVTVLDGARGQRLDIPGILEKHNDRTHVYVCGPDCLLSAVTTAAKDFNFPLSNIHSEAFVVETSGDPFSVELGKSGGTLDVKAEYSLLDVLRDAGFDIPSTCEVGNCGSCKVEVCSGKVEHRGTGLSRNEKKDAMLSCVSRGVGRITLDL
ncbi:Phthalate 4,5-dioxygenase oxygenase reductase subunit [Lachnellula occidentalis]|uniref:Phthalate 4,5-dioxygenase oxygenase reductase subunit n=1 Tax=Lachnellula occidentalis TaxID=215460 RepID=A0A8H8RP39_9HELO|nr:Phthalate 4,5-dioxygenase oxygenase reductase subunit [Lachnellula occidentalis]